MHSGACGIDGRYGFRSCLELASFAQQRLADSRRDFRGLIERRIRHDDDELLAAIACRDIVCPNALGDAIGDCTKRQVPNQMSVSIVELLQWLASAMWRRCAFVQGRRVPKVCRARLQRPDDWRDR